MNVKQIKTEKFEGLAVLLPEDAYWPTIKHVKYSDGKEYYMVDYYFSENHTGGFLLWYKDFGGRKNYPKEGELVLLGKATELTEEQCAEIITSDEWPMEVKGKIYWPDFNYIDEQVLDSAKESLSTLMDSLGAYSENPELNDCHDGERYVFDKWKKAEENTGTWLILKKAAA